MNRVWTFIISKPLSKEDLNLLSELGNAFVLSWTAHEQKLTAHFEIFKSKIIIVRVNEGDVSASGCSIDKLTQFIKAMEKQFNIELLNRLLVAFKKQDEVEIIHSSAIKNLLHEQVVSKNTVVYNTSVNNEQEFLAWEQELQNTWLSKYISDNEMKSN